MRINIRKILQDYARERERERQKRERYRHIHTYIYREEETERDTHTHRERERQQDTHTHTQTCTALRRRLLQIYFLGANIELRENQFSEKFYSTTPEALAKFFGGGYCCIDRESFFSKIILALRRRLLQNFFGLNLT